MFPRSTDLTHGFSYIFQVQTSLTVPQWVMDANSVSRTIVELSPGHGTSAGLSTYRPRDARHISRFEPPLVLQTRRDRSPEANSRFRHGAASQFEAALAGTARSSLLANASKFVHDRQGLSRGCDGSACYLPCWSPQDRNYIDTARSSRGWTIRISGAEAVWSWACTYRVARLRAQGLSARDESACRLDSFLEFVR